MSSVHGLLISIDGTTISAPKKTVIGQKTDAARKRDGTDIARTDTDQTMTTIGTTTTGTTNTSQDIHGMIDILPIEAHDPRVIIGDPRTIITMNLLTPNLEGLFNTPSRGTIRPAHGHTPRLQESQLTAHTIPLKASKEKQATRHRSHALNVTNQDITPSNVRPMIEEKHLS